MNCMKHFLIILLLLVVLSGCARINIPLERALLPFIIDARQAPNEKKPPQAPTDKEMPKVAAPSIHLVTKEHPVYSMKTKLGESDPEDNVFEEIESSS